MADVKSGKKKVWFGQNLNSNTGIKNEPDKNVSVAPGKFTKKNRRVVSTPTSL